MAKNHVHTPFSLTEDSGNIRKFAAGDEVPRELADHWYVKLHVGDAPAVDLATEAAADELLAELEAKSKELDEREKAADQLKKDLQAGFDDLRTLKAEVEARVLAADQREADLNARAEALDGREVAIAEREKAVEVAAQEVAAKDAAAKDAGQQGRRQGK